MTVDGGSFEVARRSLRVAPVCGYVESWSGASYAFSWDEEGTAWQLLRQLPAQYVSASWPDYELHAGDTTGNWWVPMCSDATWTDSPEEYVVYRDGFYAAHNPVYVMPGDPVPTPEVDPAVLAQIAFESMDLPHGTIRWNPSVDGGATVVNLDTWVWVEGAPTSVSVTAQIPSGTWARVDAQLSGLQLSAPGADPATCPDTGVAWSPGATTTSCSLVFFRSSANQPVKAGQVLPTATLTASARWTASWVSSLDATPTPLPTQEITTTAEVPVAEIQSLVTLG